MKKLLSTILILLALCLPAVAQSNRITITITITNSPYPTNGDTLTINGDIRTWTNSSAATNAILEDPTLGGCAFNLLTAAATTPFAGPVQVYSPASNVVVFVGQPNEAMVASLATNWGGVSYQTNLVSSGVPVVVPFTNEAQSTTAQFEAGNLVAGINAFTSNTWADNVLPAYLTNYRNGFTSPTLTLTNSPGATENFNGSITATHDVNYVFGARAARVGNGPMRAT